MFVWNICAYFIAIILFFKNSSTSKQLQSVILEKQLFQPIMKNLFCAHAVKCK